jgi:hypothetical protein
VQVERAEEFNRYSVAGIPAWLKAILQIPEDLPLQFAQRCGGWLHRWPWWLHGVKAWPGRHGGDFGHLSDSRSARGADLRQPGHLVLHGLLVPTTPLSVNLLSRNQQDVSAAFGGGVPQDERLRIGDWREGTGRRARTGGGAGQPVLRDRRDACLRHPFDRHRPGSFGEGQRNEVDPLIYQDGRYL